VFADLAFFSFVQLTDPSRHRAYNEWHQLDHRPENLALPGVAWGDRWGRRGDLKEHGSADTEFAGVDYAAMYWFRAPVEDSVAAWDRLGEDSFQWGRGPIIPGVTRPLLGFFHPVAGYAAKRIGVGPDVVPFRPNRGIHLTLASFDDHHGLDAHEHFRWEDQELIPALIEQGGVAGAWTFSFSHSQQHSSLPVAGDASLAPRSLRIRLLYLDGDPVATAASIAQVTAACAEEAAPAAIAAGRTLLSGPLSTIIPWQDW